MVVSEAKYGTPQEFSGQHGYQASRDYPHPPVEQLFADEINGDNSQGTQNSGEIGTNHINSMLAWCPEANQPDDTGEEPVKERKPRYDCTIGEIGIDIKANKVGKIVDKIVHQSHMIVGINAGKLYPVTAEDLVVGKTHPKVKRNSEEYS